MADEARLHELLDLVEQARREGDAATEAKAVAAYKRESAPAQPQPAAQPFPDTYGGTGGNNPMLSMLGGGALKAGASLGMTPENTANPIANAAGPAEAALQFGTGGAAMIPAGLMGIGQGLKNKFFPDATNMSAADRVNKVQGALTYQPRTGAGAGMSTVANAPLAAYAAGTNKAGEFVADKTGMPSLGALVKTAGDVAPSLLGAKGVTRPGARPAGEYVPKADVIPTTAELRSASNALYKASDAAGVVIKPESTAKAAQIIQQVADSENLGKLTPKLKEAHDILTERAASGKALSLKDADKARQLIGDAIQSTDAGDRRVATIVQQAYDGYLNNLSPQDTIAGNTPEGLAYLQQARQMWGRLKNSETLDTIQRNAEVDGEAKYTQAGTEHALRTEFKKLYKREDSQRFMTPEQQAAVRKVAAPGPAANALRNLGKMDPSRGGMAAALNNIVGGGIGAGLGAMVGGLPGAAGGGLIGKTALGTAASMANMGALRGTMSRVASAREALVGRGLPQTPVAARSVFEPIAKPAEAPVAAPAVRAPAQIELELQHLQVLLNSVQDGAPAAYVQGLKRRQGELRDELAKQKSQGVLGDANAQRPTK